jgi:hypothetical protein
MKKLQLDLGALAVDSFDLSTTAIGTGTVLAHQSRTDYYNSCFTCVTCVGITCP